MGGGEFSDTIGAQAESEQMSAGLGTGEGTGSHGLTPP